MADKEAELARLRSEIDRVDRAMHELLMERGQMISAISAAKGVGAAKGSGAMRPAREAQMMRAIAARHQGPFPLASVERIWREIIGAFTQMQAGFDVYATGADKSALAESSRFYFGALSPVMYLESAEEVLAKIDSDIRAVGFLMEPVAKLDGIPWWASLALKADRKGRIVARTPFLTGTGAPCWIVSQAPFELSGDDCTLVALRGERATALLDNGAVEIDRALVNGKDLIMIGIEGYFSAGELVAKIGSNEDFEYLGGYARMDRTESRNND